MCGACVLCVDLLCLPGSWCGEPVKSSFSERVTGYQSESKGCQVSSWFCQKGCFIASTEQTIMNYSSYAWHLLYVPKLHRVIDFNIYLKLLYICNFLAAIQDVFFPPLVQIWLQLLQNFWEIKVPISLSHSCSLTSYRGGTSTFAFFSVVFTILQVLLLILCTAPTRRLENSSHCFGAFSHFFYTVVELLDLSSSHLYRMPARRWNISGTTGSKRWSSIIFDSWYHMNSISPDCSVIW